MNINYDLEKLNTVVLIRDCDGHILKISRKVSDSFYMMLPLSDNIYFESQNNLYFRKNSELITIDDCEYYQEEYINVTKLVLENAKLLKELKKDPLTRIYNVTAVSEKRQEIQLLNKECIIAMIDINQFKVINDNYGHQAGDNALIEVAKLFKRNIRDGNDLVARIGGDEFVCLFLTSDIPAIIEKLCIIHDEVVNLGTKLGMPLSISTGIALFTPGNDWDNIKKNADDALYYAKYNYKGSIAYYNSSTNLYDLYHIPKQKEKIKQ